MFRRFIRSCHYEAISPLDGRYRNMMQGVPTQRDRLVCQLETMIAWTQHVIRKSGRNCHPFKYEMDDLIKSYQEHEKRVGHDVKAMEYAIRELFSGNE